MGLGWTQRCQSGKVQLIGAPGGARVGVHECSVQPPPPDSHSPARCTCSEGLEEQHLRIQATGASLVLSKSQVSHQDSAPADLPEGSFSAFRKEIDPKESRLLESPRLLEAEGF